MVVIAVVFVFIGCDGIYDHSDEQVEDDEGGDQDEQDEEHPRIGKLFHHGACNAVGPALQRHHLEQGERNGTQAAKPFREVFVKQIGGNHRGYIENDHDQAKHRAQAWQRAE